MFDKTILMTEEYWANSQLSIARYYGGIKINKTMFQIVNREGITLFELSNPASKYYKANGKAIEPGEPADLVCIQAIPAYKKLGRDRFIQLLQDGAGLDKLNEEAGL